MKKSAGLLLIKNDRMLLGHPTGANWFGSYSIPKGGIEENETPLDAAIRETKEEVGIVIPIEKIDVSQIRLIEYRDRKNKKYKEIYYFIVDVSDMNIPDILTNDMLQLDEIDWAGFLTVEQAESRILPRMSGIIKTFLEIKNKI